MYSKILGLIITIIGLYFLVTGLNAFSNPWPLGKILFVFGIHVIVGIIPLIIGLKLLMKKTEETSS